MKLYKCTNCGCVVPSHIMKGGACDWCGSTELLDKISIDAWKQADLRDAWQAFADIPIDDLDRIEEDFMDFPAGEIRFEIWKWFDRMYEGGVKKLIEDTEVC